MTDIAPCCRLWHERQRLFDENDSPGRTTLAVWANLTHIEAACPLAQQPTSTTVECSATVRTRLGQEFEWIGLMVRYSPNWMCRSAIDDDGRTRQPRRAQVQLIGLWRVSASQVRSPEWRAVVDKCRLVTSPRIHLICRDADMTLCHFSCSVSYWLLVCVLAFVRDVHYISRCDLAGGLAA